MMEAAPDRSQVTAPGLLRHTRHNTEASSIGMRFWARSIGDRNPRHVAESYVSPSGGLGFVAHPCWLYSVQDTIITAGAPHLHPVIAGTEWTFRRHVVAGDRVYSVARLLGEKVRKTRFAGPSAWQRIGVQYVDAIGAEIATAVSTLVRVDPEAARKGSRHAGWRRWRYTEEELLRIERAYDAEQVRGGEPRHWEDVAVGESLPPIVRGPLSSEEVVLFVGATRPIPGAAAFTRDLAQGRAAGFIHPRTGAYESYAAGLVDDESARQLGFPAAHDYGIDRISQLGSIVINWIGDAGRLLQLNARLLEPNMLGDTTWFSGGVVGKQALEGDGRVDIEVLGTNQRGQVTVHGTAGASLPRRGWTQPEATR